MTSNSIFNWRGDSWKGRLSVVFLVGMGIIAGVWQVSKISFHSSRATPVDDPSSSTTQDDDPRLSFQTRYRNVRPDVRYVGDEACIRCHRAMAEAYRKHPMARSLAPVAQAEQVERYDAAAHNPFDAAGLRYEVDRTDRGMIHAEKRLNSLDQVVGELKAEVQYALGSGVRGRSYLVEHDGFLFQSPASWYAETKVWDLAAGYRSRNRHFTRPVGAECIYCHANRAEAVDNSVNHFRTPVFQGYAIGCERCHGPGELHVQLRESNKSFAGEDDTIVVPDRLDTELRESVCQQCHLQAVIRSVKRNRRREDYRPGLPLKLFVSFFVLPPNQVDTKRAVSQVEQMYASRCFQESGGKADRLGCLTCHDPHYYPAASEKVKYYSDRCLTCHAEMDCGLELSVRRVKSPKDNCIECHMPSVASSNIAHAAITDHRIVRLAHSGVSGPHTPVWPGASAGKGAPQKYPLVPFFNDEADSSNPERQRDLGVALVKLATQRRSPKLGQLALPLLDVGLQRWPDDVPAWEARGYALHFQGKNEEALDAFLSALQLSPDREWSLFGAAQLTSQLGRSEAAVTFWQRAIALNPWNWEYHDELAKVYALGQEWKNAAEQCQETLKLNIAASETRTLLVKCLLRLGEKTKARKEFKILLDFEPPDPEALRRWFAEEGR